MGSHQGGNVFWRYELLQFVQGLDSRRVIAGHVVGGSGMAGYGSHLSKGDTDGALFGPGLLKPETADLHVVIRTHGPAEGGMTNDEIHSFGVCNPTCTDLQFAVFEQVT